MTLLERLQCSVYVCSLRWKIRQCDKMRMQINDIIASGTSVGLGHLDAAKTELCRATRDFETMIKALKLP